jgi:hypothetical protein
VGEDRGRLTEGPGCRGKNKEYRYVNGSGRERQS